MDPNVRHLVAGKRVWQEPLSSADESRGFRGWHERGYLPHFDVPGVRQMVNFRLADALPGERRHEWEGIFALTDDRCRYTQLEAYCDRGHGACELRQPEIAARFEEILLHDHGRRCGLLAWIIMPNHVHLLVEVWNTPLAKLVQSWKKLGTRCRNTRLGRRGQWWQEDYFDRLIRDEAHFHRAVRYIEENPIKAGLVNSPREWPWRSARWRPEGPGLQPWRKP
jgi:REP element-mobilizing transposase RayT